MQISPVAILLARIFFASAFIHAGWEHFSDLERTTGTVGSAGWPAPRLFGIGAFGLALLGGLSVLLGFEARIGALALIVFLIPATLASHSFWRAKDGEQRRKQLQQFMKNMTTIGGALAFFSFGSGPWSLN